MAEDGSAQEGEKPESQRPGSGGGFVSLDQARDIALGHARENPDFYGRRYRKKELAWEVLSQEEREDGYLVRLSYRPARGFRGEPGVEQFSIDRTGPVQSRRIVSEPVRKGGFPGCGLVAIGGLVFATAALVGVISTVL